jgi:hypothetical protein
MTDIATILENIAEVESVMQTALTTALAQGVEKTSVADATRTAAAALHTLADRTKAEQKKIASDNNIVSGGLKARKDSLADVAAARTQGDHPPLSDAEAASLKQTVATVNGVDETKLDAKGVAAVKDIDTVIDKFCDAQQSELQNAQNDLATKLAKVADARDKALQVLVTIQSAPSDVTARLNAAKTNRTQATQLAGSVEPAAKSLAVVAYADYDKERQSLAMDAGDVDGNALKTSWNTAAEAWQSALADAAEAEKTLIERRLALEKAIAEQATKRKTRNSDAAAKVREAFGKP